MAKMSLLDYSWRREIFSSERASQAESSTLSKMTGTTQTYTPIIRPMSLGSSESDLGPLGISESKAVAWLEDVMDAEARRAQRIVDDTGGNPAGLVRPMNEGGPLGEIEEMAVGIYEEIRESEKLRGYIATKGRGDGGEGGDGEEGGEGKERDYGVF
ncbi:hypothetical protein TrRE_jg6616, partial [Triparma retinervis]